MKTHGAIFSSISVLLILLLGACAGEPAPPAAGCNPDPHGFIPLPTRPLGVDPDLYQPPAGQVPGGSGDCTLLPTATPTGAPPTAFTLTGLRNETLDSADQQLVSAAVGDDILALAWLRADDLYVSLARGGSFLQARRVDRAQNAHLVFSTVNRLHLVYEQDGQIHYRAADQNAHPAQPIFWVQVGAGSNPQVALDGRNWAHVLYEADGVIWHAAHVYELLWHTTPVGPGHSPQVTTFHDNPATPQVNEGGFALSYIAGSTLHLRAYGVTLLGEPGWAAVAEIPLAEQPAGPVRLHSVRAGDGNRLLAAAWLSHIPASPPPPVPVPPTYSAVNPLAPNAVVEPQWVHEAFNAARISARDALFDGGLSQRVPVMPGTAVTFSAYGNGWSSAGDDPDVPLNPASLQLLIGIDPSGGTNPDSGMVVWSAAANPLHGYIPFSVAATAVSDHVTLYLRARPDDVRAHNATYWDGATLVGGNLVNGDMEAPFHDGVPAGWVPFFFDGETGSPAPRDRTTVYAVWSPDGGATWQGPQAVNENRLPGQGLTGIIQPAVYPLLSLDTASPSLHLFAIYAQGNPPPGSSFIRYGRPVVLACVLAGSDLADATCADPPGVTLAPETPPAFDLVVAAHPLDRRRALLGWGGLQTDYRHRDVYAAMVALR